MLAHLIIMNVLIEVLHDDILVSLFVQMRTPLLIIKELIKILCVIFLLLLFALECTVFLILLVVTDLREILVCHLLITTFKLFINASLLSLEGTHVLHQSTLVQVYLQLLEFARFILHLNLKAVLSCVFSILLSSLIL